MNALSEAPVHWDPYNPKYFANPYPVFRRLREEAPVYYNEEYEFYAVSRYDDVQNGLADRDTFISGRGGVLEFIKSNIPVPKGVFIFEDPPLHGIHRGALTRVFTPKRMTALEPQIRDFCAKALDPLVEGGEFNFIEDLGKEMPMRVIGMLLGIPEEDLKVVQENADANLRTEPGKPMEVSQHNFMGEGFAEYIAWRAKHPSDDLMTELLSAEIVDETGQTRRLSHEEIIIFCSILAGAGNETTNRLIGWTGKVLAEHPDQRRQIYENRGLIPQAIEELLRFEAPGPSVARYVAKDTEIRGTKIAAGSAVCFLVASANRDADKFANGEQFDINRERVPHLTFGHGFHVCIGNALARVEGRVALDEILKRFPEWDVDLENARLSSTSTVRGWETLPAFTPKARARRAAAPTPAKPAAAEAGPERLPGAEAWQITLQTPMGPQEMTAQFVRDGDAFTGRIDSPMGSEVITDGRIAGDALTWTMEAKKPAPIKLSFEVVVTGDELAGSAKLGMFGKAQLSGRRA
ncbi:cytochrome P450 [Phenylobacterium sp. LjRoot219]|uniref:cytochrome P450 n=1 Tax=Phenylobacterium sp. LjRoot219 TaxID=3342283 RepID=UPI003ECD7734